jgi:CopG family nickel-responsive transcriptional regulator
MLEVLLVQGPASQLQTIANEMIALRGVITGHLQLLAAVIPPLHAPNQASKE